MNIFSPRLPLLIFALGLAPINQTNSTLSQRKSNYKVRGKIDKALYGYSFLNITEISMERCLAQCLENCHCMSFQMCENKECQLCSSNKEQNPSAFNERKGCTNFVFERDQCGSRINEQCDQNCFTEVNCCMTSATCLNGGTCVPSTDTKTRFRCRCPVGYTGDRCQHLTTRSCRGYISGSRISKKYMVLDDNMKPFEVFCDFDSTSTMAWTLIQSYQLENKKQFQEPFFVDDPVNQDSPIWDSYRLSKSRMESIQRDSNKWRITCQYDTDGVVYTDYVRGTNDKINILTYDTLWCKEVEYINIRGQSCTNCTSLVGQISNLYPLHFESHRAKEKDCYFQPSGSLKCGSGWTGETNFGFYRCENPAHRCSANLTSTTQTWFGGN